MESWDTFTVVVGGAAAALLGLLFVAISIRLDTIMASTELRSRAAQTLVLFVSTLLLSLLLSVPGQPVRLLGGELMALAVLSGAALLALDRRAGQPSGQRINRVLDLVSPNVFTSLLLFAAGLVLALGLHAGLYVLVLPVLAAFLGGVTSAWLFMTRVPR